MKDAEPRWRCYSDYADSLSRLMSTPGGLIALAVKVQFIHAVRHKDEERVQLLVPYIRRTSESVSACLASADVYMI